MASYPFFATDLPSSPLVSHKKGQQQQQQNDSPAPVQWRLREAAQAIIDERMGESKKEVIMYLTTNFPTDFSSLLPFHCDHQVIARAFTLAARSVLNAMRKTHNEHDQDDNPQRFHNVTIPHLPAMLQVREAVRLVRAAALQRSLENKEWTKRKAKASGHAIVPSKVTSTTTTTISSSSLTNNTTANTKSSSKLFDPSSSSATAATTTTTETETAPKFTRNTPASSAAALDHRFTNSRAILCAAGNLCLGHATADPADVPQKDRLANLGAVIVDATVYARRTRAVAEHAVRRVTWRYQFRQAHHKAQRKQQQQQHHHHPQRKLENDITTKSSSSSSPFGHLNIPHLFLGPQRKWLDEMWDEDKMVPYQPNLVALTDAWEMEGRSALQQILETSTAAIMENINSSNTTIGNNSNQRSMVGTGNALYYDTEWNTRHGRLGDFIRTQARQDELGWGPHLIITTQPEVDLFCQEFHDWRTYLDLRQARDNNIDSSMKEDYHHHHHAHTIVRACRYAGKAAERRQLRKMWSSATGLPEDPIHVVCMSYAVFLEDYLHVCQVPWGTVILDDTACWMAASQGDPNSSLAAIWDSAIWASNDHYTGLAGTALSAWDFALEDWRSNLTVDEASQVVKDAYVGLTAQNRIITASKLVLEQRQNVDLLPVSGIVNFVAPHFAGVVREEWDRNNIAKDTASMDHFRRLVARYTVVHHPDILDCDMKELAVRALEGKVAPIDEGPEALAPVEVTEEDFVSADKVTYSRRACLGWLGPELSCLRYELGRADFQPILDILKISTKHGHYCEEVTTASTMTTSGATGQVAGTMAYRMAIRCGRHFGSEQGLRQHLSAQHAPPGTWLCRTCGSDCITSQARTHHERACGQPSGSGGGGNDTSGSVGATPTVGQGGSKSGVGKKKSQRSSAGQGSGGGSEEKDVDGSFRVPGYRGVWVTKQGKHFIKVDGKRFENDGETHLFDTIDDAAKKYDKIVSAKKNEGTVELNFKPDGTRNVYEDSTSTAASGVGGSAANVVPLLSVINIKDLPPDVKPLLRDPRQTSRTGGNSKRHVYAYRGVCRQARKGHDRWQSQISFMGVNHYLGTFDSEWDAAAIYAWAHLILYGEEATRQAQKEGEEAAAAYEQEKRDIAAGKIPEPPPKPEKKKVVKKKESKEKGGGAKKKKTDASNANDVKGEGKTTAPESSKKRKATPKDSSPAEKKPRVDAKHVNSKQQKDVLSSVLSKGVAKAPILGHRELLESISDSDLRDMVSTRLRVLRETPDCLCYPENFPSPTMEPLRSCVPVQNNSRNAIPIGAAMLVGIPANIGWSFPDFITENGIQQDISVVQILAVEYDEEGLNEKFQTVIQGSVCVIGQASKRMLRQFQEIGGGSVAMGSGVGPLDCHIGGAPGTCSPRAACIRFDGEVFRITCLNDSDVVTLNGERLKSGGEGSILYNYDVCSVGPRVFAFVLPVSR